MESSPKDILIGPADEKIKQLLSQADPLEVIKTIQRDYGLAIPSIDATFAMMDLCGYSRYEIHLACLDALNNAVIEKIKSPAFQLEHFYDIFDRLLPYIHLSYMQPIPMALLEKFGAQVDESVLLKLKDNPAIFDNCPMNVKKRIWKKDETFFQQKMLIMLNNYHHDERLQKLSMDLRPQAYQHVFSERRQHPILIEIIELIGNDPVLYNMFVNMIRLVFRATPYPSLCSLRVDLLMHFHEKDVSAICEADKCHRLVWSLDSCVKSQVMDEQIIEKIKECFDNVKNGTPLYGDFAMVLMDPLVSNFLSHSIVRWLRIGVHESGGDRLDELINYNAKLLNLAQHAPTAIAKSTKIPKLDKNVKDHFWKAMLEMITDEGTPNAKTLSVEAITAIEDLLVNNEVTRKTYAQYVMDRMADSDIHTLHRALPLILHTLPVEGSADIQHTTTYKALIYSITQAIEKRHRFDIVIETIWRNTIMDEFLLKVIDDIPSAVPGVVHLLISIFDDSRSSALTPDHRATLANWANLCALQAAKEQDEVLRQALRKDFESLLMTANRGVIPTLCIEPAAVQEFCQSVMDTSA
ncbi:hypothetical protein DM01DRAFT_1334977, partial [Hesseltinella vesiculosa]